MSKQPPVDELEFLRYVPNHRELAKKLTELRLDVPDLLEYAQYVAECWFRLAESHLEDAEKANASHSDRSAYSRSYYAAYNASKAVRYLASGSVSLKADDHKKAPDLPDTFPTVALWSQTITTLYEHRLSADYDNWTTTATTFSMTPDRAVTAARDFLRETREYLNSKYGMSL